MSTSLPPEEVETIAQQIEKLLTGHMGPMAKIILARARKKGGDDQSLLNTLAAYIDDEVERASFLAAAAQVLAARKKSGDVTTLSFVRDAAPQPVTAAPPVQPPVHAPVPVPETRPQAAHAEPTRSAPAPAAPQEGSPPAFFVSYARDNLDAAKQLVEALRAAGLEVWLDLGKLQAGDAWDLKIRRNIKTCSFFIALISRETDARQEGYFRREWAMAADRALYFADDVPFLLPVIIDDSRSSTARVPERFRAAHWTTLRGGQATPEFVEHLRQLVEDNRRRARSG
jgi:hypothetical protein